jgi:hypothetical protein
MRPRLFAAGGVSNWRPQVTKSKLMACIDLKRTKFPSVRSGWAKPRVPLSEVDETHRHQVVDGEFHPTRTRRIIAWWFALQNSRKLPCEPVRL